MSLTARLHIEGHKKENEGIRVLSYNFNFFQDTDSRGMTTSLVKSGWIHLSVTGAEDPEIVEWMLNHTSMKNGRIAFSGFGESGPTRKLIFEDAFLVYYKEIFTDQSDLVIELSISARKITVAGIDYEVFWSDSLK